MSPTIFLIAAGLAIATWATALATVFRSRKFGRKWLWALLTFAVVGGPEVSIGGWTLWVGIPVGAVAVLLIAAFAPYPKSSRHGLDPSADSRPQDSSDPQ